MTAVNGFGPWLKRASEIAAAIPPFTREEYRSLSTSDVLTIISLEERARLIADTDDQRDKAEFALQELRAVLQERR